MTMPICCIWLASGLLLVDKTSVEFYQDTFVIRQKGGVVTAPLTVPSARPILHVAYRRNQNYAVWDDRGLTIRQGKRAKSFLLSEVAVSPRVFTRAEILKTLDLVKRGNRKKEASAISGSRRIGSTVYFLVRWDDSSGHPWSENLISVDLADPKPVWHLRGKFDGISTATMPIDDRLTLVLGQPTVVVRRQSDWGVASFDPKTGQFDFRIVGDRLAGLRTNQWFSERTPYGTTLIGALDLSNATRTVWAESRGNLKFLDDAQPPILISLNAEESSLLNAETGAKLMIPVPPGVSVGVRRVGKFLVIWSPLEAPTAAWVYGTATFSLEAQWKKASVTKTANP